MDRRKFLGALGASAALSGIPSYAGQHASKSHDSTLRISLNGPWEQHIAGKLLGTVAVPSSRRPVGYYTLRRKFVLPALAGGQRAFLRLDAITYWGRVTVNGKQLGTMDPYIPYDFEFTSVAKEGINRVQVEIVDLTPLPDGSGKDQIAIGLNPGWEAYGGIIRDVWVELRPESFVENVRVAYRLGNGFKNCHVAPRIMISSASQTSAKVESMLWKSANEVARVATTVALRPGMNDVELEFDVSNPALWSPSHPEMYQLTASLLTASSENQWSGKIGFREMRTRGRDFILNGERIVLNGVCRHDLWKGQGFTLTPSQQERDMRMIKTMGCNFVRLVHYPHDRRIIELADELGLMVSEEPGYWQMNFSTMSPSEIELGYRILEGAIRRDWNSPSVIIWFLSNECTLTEASMAEGKARCNRLDPIHRMVSVANSHKSESVKPLFVASGMDFFDQHPYTTRVARFAEEAEFYGANKPLTFSEWGGREIGQTPILMRETVDSLIALVKNHGLAGHMFWSWQDMREYTRIDSEMVDGVLESGVVTEDREPRDEVYEELARLFELRPPADEPREVKLEILPLRKIPWSGNSQFETVDLQPFVESPNAAKAWDDLRAQMAKYWDRAAKGEWEADEEDLTFWRGIKLQVEGVPFSLPVIKGRVRPVAVTPATPEVSIPVGKVCTRIHIMGQVTLPDGYPIVGSLGDPVGAYVLHYADGTTEQIPLRNGYEVARSNCIYSATRIDPVALNSQPVLRYIKNPSREHYQVLLFSISLKPKQLAHVTCRLNEKQFPLVIFAITAEQARKS